MENESLYQLQQRYLQYCSIIRNYKKSTLNSYKSTFNLFMKETELKSPSALNKAVVENWFDSGRLKRNWSASTFRSYRNYALIGIMLLAGLRRNETINLKLNDISLNNRTIFIQQGKGSKDRMIPINNRLGRINDH